MSDGSKIPAGVLDGARLAALDAYAVLDTPPEPGFDDVVHLARRACDAPVALISLVAGDRQWFKARAGFEACRTELEASVCAHALGHSDLLVIPDLTRDPRTRDNPLVTGAPHLRFYAGAPLHSPEGLTLGTLCVLDSAARPGGLTPAQAEDLAALARQVMAQLALRRALAERRAVPASAARYRAVFESAIDYAIVVMDLDGRITDWNAGAARILGWTPAEICGQSAEVFFTPEDRAEGIPGREMRSTLAAGRGIDERWHLRKGGTRFWASGEMMALRDAAGTAVGFVKILRDRTEQRLAAQRRRADAEFMRSVLAASADCIKVLDLDARLTFMSEGGMKVMEVSDFNAIEGCPWPDFWHGQGHADAIAAVAAARAGRVGHFQGGADTMAGTPRWWDVQVTPILDAEGRPEKLLCVSRDITRQKVAEADLATSAARWRGLFEGMQEGFFVGELVRDGAGRAVDYRFLEINPAFARQSGLPPDSVGRTIRSFVPDIAQGLIDRYAQVVDTGAPALFEIGVAHLGRHFEVRANRDGGERFACLFLDITERKRAEVRQAALLALGDRLRDLDDPGDIAGTAAAIAIETLGLVRAGYGAADPERETVTIERDWHAPGLASIAGLHRFRDYGSYIEALKRGETVVVEDTAADPRTAADCASLAAIDVRAFVNIPLMERGRFVGLFFLLSATPRTWSAEDVAFLRNLADRTRAAIARVEAEAQRRLLNHELSHRMKNLLAMVQSIATQTMRGAADVDTAREVLAGRLIALGKAHDLLMGGALASTRMEPVIRGALEVHADRPDRFRLGGPGLEIGPDRALSLALMLHELATNAAKYGALAGAGGHVDVAWAILPGEGEPRLSLSWREVGGPPVTPPTRKGFGSRFIERGLASQVGGELVLAYPPSGLTCTLTAPLAAFRADPPPGA